MKCPKSRKLLSNSHEENISQELKDHLSHCKLCRQKFIQSVRITKLLKYVGNNESLPDPPSDFNQDVMEGVYQADKKFNPGFGLRVGLTAFVFILVLASAFLLNIGSFQNRDIKFVMQDDVKIKDTDDLQHAKSELIRLLTQTIEIIERGDQEWEIEI
ncbi:hypothetical protein GF312_07035 [Candidatus Poribacteria bacterium]|nr:hypothetical protein [Candidatus Poribacteria bacterium]